MAGTGADGRRVVTARRTRRVVVRHLLVAVAVLAAAVLLPGVALADPPGPATVTPLLDCVTHNSDGTFTAVVGYSNTTGSPARIPFGPLNVLSPTTYDHAQPTTFAIGTQHGVFAVRLSAYDAIYAYPTWQLDGHTLGWSDKSTLSDSCPSPTQLPAQGNGTGATIALVAAGVLGVVLLARERRRALQAG